MERGEARGERSRDLRRKVVFGSIFIFLKKSGMVWSPPATIACSFLSPDTCSIESCVTTRPIPSPPPMEMHREERRASCIGYRRGKGEGRVCDGERERERERGQTLPRP